ncbi:hypothetical protein FRB99_003890 [Tulasnella sp. 403]|nr:hypothetical protein FRB99_003890 [Tulasnella sp. 403]
MEAMRPIRVSVLGMGLSATVFHIPLIQALPGTFKLHSILERSATHTSSEARARYGDIKIVTTLDDVLQDGEVDCVVISTPNSTHFSFAKAALEAGKHVIIEKPLVPSVGEADILIAIAAPRNLIIATFQNRRFDSDYLTLKSVLDRLGDLVEFESHYDRWRPSLKGGTWKETAGRGQGIVYDLGSHLIDQILQLFGSPDRLFAHIYNSRNIGPPDFDDAFTAHFYYDNRNLPLIVTLKASPLSALDPQLRFSVKGTKGSFVKYGLDQQEDQLKLGIPTDHPNFGREPEAFQPTLTTLDANGSFISERIPTLQGSYLQWYANVGSALQANDPAALIVKPEQARETIRIIELMYQSSSQAKVLSLI